MLSHNAFSFKQIGIAQIILGVLSFIWQIGILACTTQEDIYEEKREYARDIAYSSTGFWAGLAFIVSGFYSYKCCGLLNEPTSTNPSPTIRISKGLDIVCIVLAILLDIFSGYLAHLTSHWYKEENLQTARLAHAALPFHVLHCLTGAAEIVFAALELRLKPSTRPLPPVIYETKINTNGVENPGYAENPSLSIKGI